MALHSRNPRPRIAAGLAAAATALALLTGPPGPSSATAAPAPAGAPAPVGPAKRVLAISVDGLNPAAIRRLGGAGAPAFHRLLGEGAGTLNARTAVEQTVTLPNHASMLTGRRIRAAAGGHGVTWDGDRPGTTVPAGDSIFSVVEAAGGSTALFTTKPKFALYDRSWPIDEFTADERTRRLVRLARADLAAADRDFTFLHVSLPDHAGHAHRGLSPAYVDAVRRTDRLLGRVLATVEAEPGLAVVLTADHGFARRTTSHSDRDKRGNYTVPFLVWGPGVSAGDLYALNPGYADPGRARPGYRGAQPIRNGDVANLATAILGLGPVPGSQIGVAPTLEVGPASR